MFENRKGIVILFCSYPKELAEKHENLEVVMLYEDCYVVFFPETEIKQQ